MIMLFTTYHAWRNNPVIQSESEESANYQDTPGFRKSVTLEEVKAPDYKLTPGIYVGTEAEDDDGVPFEEKMEKLKMKLEEQFEESSKLQNRILKTIKNLNEN